MIIHNNQNKLIKIFNNKIIYLNKIFIKKKTINSIKITFLMIIKITQMNLLDKKKIINN